MARLNLHRVEGPGNSLAGLVDCALRPVRVKALDDPPGISWAEERVTELRRAGVDADVLRLPGEPPLVRYRTLSTPAGMAIKVATS